LNLKDHPEVPPRQQRQQVSISPTFYEQLFCGKVFFVAFLCIEFGFVISNFKNSVAKAAPNFFVELTTVFHFPDATSSGGGNVGGSGSRAGSAERRLSSTTSPYSVVQVGSAGQGYIDSPRRIDSTDSSRRSVLT
jgi:hypothetical protein